MRWWLSSALITVALGCAKDTQEGGSAFGDGGNGPTDGSTGADTSATAPGSSGGADGSSGTAADSTGAQCEDMQTFFADTDEDGFGNPDVSMDACEAPDGFVDVPGDCDDMNAEVNPDAVEVCDDIDGDCDGIIDEFSPSNVTCNGCELQERDGHAYFFCLGPSNWESARTSCQIFNAELTSIQDLAEHNYIVAQIPPTNHWIGLNDHQMENTFEWTDGSPAVYVNWAPGEPNNNNMTENCVELESLSSFQWNDNVCSRMHNYVCEAEPTSTP